ALMRITVDEDHADHERALARALDAIPDAQRVIEEVQRFSVAAPSWAVGTGGTRFGRFPCGGEPRTIEEKIDDVAALNALTGANRTVSLHVPWDDPGTDASGLRGYAEGVWIGFDAITWTTFQDHPST